MVYLSAAEGGYGGDEGNVCVAKGMAVAILVIFVLVCLVSLVLTAVLCWRAHRGYGKQAIYPRPGYYTPSSTPTQSVPSPAASTQYSVPSTAVQRNRNYN